MPQPLRPLLICTALALSLSATGALAAPKHDKAERHNAGHDNEVNVHLNGPSIDLERIRLILGDNRHLLAPTSGLPPGIAKNLARGKPLPPGIAKKFDPRLRSQLPYYEGYEWKQVGRDVVLQAITTGIVYEVLRNVLD